VWEKTLPERYTPSDFHSNFALSITDGDPRTIREEMNLEDVKLWKKDMVEEMTTLDKNEAWDIVEFLNGRNPTSNRWVFKSKMNAEGKVEK
jgi:hypothetical protein